MFLLRRTSTEEVNERNEIRRDRERDRVRKRNMERAGPQKKGGRPAGASGEERDISEKIALGLPSAGSRNTAETQFDQRLFNKTAVRFHETLLCCVQAGSAVALLQCKSIAMKYHPYLFNSFLMLMWFSYTAKSERVENVRFHTVVIIVIIKHW